MCIYNCWTKLQRISEFKWNYEYNVIFSVRYINFQSIKNPIRFQKKRIITIITLAISIHVSCNSCFQEDAFIILKAAFAVFVHIGKHYIKIQSDVQLFPSHNIFLQFNISKFIETWNNFLTNKISRSLDGIAEIIYSINI